ncbi:hypothetical protein K435DRAFT_785965 [Dendrothele bispora CBS 962.96]|uniref:Uncharacterized protein n=1 Tax=Dendrothele bispora (strain CBS 962.96) TaxID=1314807 RepID=A0A4S8KTD5_DENBC|nr:hypothetical protein K435DRAFT_785965 [Dendrothele bispora CBS 962.96]
MAGSLYSNLFTPTATTCLHSDSLNQDIKPNVPISTNITNGNPSGFESSGGNGSHFNTVQRL